MNANQNALRDRDQTVEVTDIDLFFPMSEKTERTGLEAVEQFSRGKVGKIENIDQFLNDL